MYIATVSVFNEGKIVIETEEGKSYYGAPLPNIDDCTSIPKLLKEITQIMLPQGFGIDDLDDACYARITYFSQQERPEDNVIINLYSDPHMSTSSFVAEIRMNIKLVTHSVSICTAGLWAPVEEKKETIMRSFME